MDPWDEEQILPRGVTLQKGYLPERDAEIMFDALSNEIPFEVMTNFGSEVPRLVCIQADATAEDDMPIYRHPADIAPRTIAFTKTVKHLATRLNADFGLKLNHALIQLYRGGTDNISEHSDKTLDIIPGSKIINVSFGARRYMTLRTKKDYDGQPREKVVIPLPHNSVFSLDLEANALYTHAIRPNKRPSSQLSAAERAYNGARISITFRQIGTYLTTDHEIYGHGAIGKSREQAQAVPNGAALDIQWADLIKSFGLENKAPLRDWNSFYGQGSNALKLNM